MTIQKDIWDVLTQGDEIEYHASGNRYAKAWGQISHATAIKAVLTTSDVQVLVRRKDGQRELISPERIMHVSRVVGLQRKTIYSVV